MAIGSQILLFFHLSCVKERSYALLGVCYFYQIPVLLFLLRWDWFQHFYIKIEGCISEDTLSMQIHMQISFLSQSPWNVLI